MAHVYDRPEIGWGYGAPIAEAFQKTEDRQRAAASLAFVALLGMVAWQFSKKRKRKR
jgi:hypothetical protein